MNSLFNVDNGIFTFLGKICDVVFLSIIWIIVCIPIITIGPATTALYYVTVKVIRRDRGYIIREFFKSFRQNFKCASIVGVGLTFSFIILSIDIFAAKHAISSNETVNSILLGIYLAITFLMLIFSIYVFPILSRFEMKVIPLIKTTIIIAIKHIFSTIAMVLMLVISLYAVYLIPFVIIAVPCVAALNISFLMERILKKYMVKSDTEDENSNKDEWYLE